jgi:hypothetical protein
MKPTERGVAMNESTHKTNQQSQPGSPNLVSRRHFIQTAAALSSLAGVTASAVAADDAGKDKDKPQTALNQPLGQDYVVVTQVPDKEHFIHDPAMTILPNGCLIVAAPVWGRGKNKDRAIHVSRSQDGGKTWTKVCEKPWCEATLYVHEGRLYMFTQIKNGGGVQVSANDGEGVWVSASDDEGRSWTDPVEVIKGRPGRSVILCHTGVVVRDGWLYYAISDKCKTMGAIACHLGKGLLNPDAWIESNLAEMPIPDALVSGSFTDGLGAVLMRSLEGNVVDVYGRTLVIARACIHHYGTQNMAAVYDLKNEYGKLRLEFTQLYPVPGGQCKFHILWDERSRLFWMASNYPTNSQDLIHAAKQFPDYKPGPWVPLREDRRILMLSYSLDALNWFPACCIAKAEKMNQSFNYPSMVIDGDDIALLSRTSLNAVNFHDADLATFHRVRNFRSLAMDIRPKL